MNTHLNSMFDFPDIPILLPKIEPSDVADLPESPPQQCLQQFLSPRNLVPQLSRRWSCGDSQQATESLPASYYHNLGVALHNHIQMSNQHYSLDFDCPPTVSPFTSAHGTSPLPPLTPYDHIGTQNPNLFSPHAYSNTMLPDNSYFENGSRSISAPSIGNPGLISSESSQSCSARRRFRTNFTELQSTFLEDSFKESHYPDHKAKKYMADYLKIPEDRITVWFQNRRAKWRRKEHRQRGRSRNETFSSSSGSFEFPCFTNPDDSPNIKHPREFGLQVSQMSHEQFLSHQDGNSSEYHHIQDHQ